MIEIIQKLIIIATKMAELPLDVWVNEIAVRIPWRCSLVCKSWYKICKNKMLKDPRAANIDLLELLIYAIQNKREDLVRMMVDENYDFSKYNNVAICLASFVGDFNIFKLIASQPKVLLTAPTNENSIVAIYHNFKQIRYKIGAKRSLQICKLIRDATDDESDYINTPIITSTLLNHDEITYYLLERVDTVNFDRILYSALSAKNYKLFELTRALVTIDQEIANELYYCAAESGSENLEYLLNTDIERVICSDVLIMGSSCDEKFIEPLLNSWQWDESIIDSIAGFGVDSTKLLKKLLERYNLFDIPNLLMQFCGLDNPRYLKIALADERAEEQIMELREAFYGIVICSSAKCLNILLPHLEPKKNITGELINDLVCRHEYHKIIQLLQYNPSIPGLISKLSDVYSLALIKELASILNLTIDQDDVYDVCVSRNLALLNRLVKLEQFSKIKFSSLMLSCGNSLIEKLPIYELLLNNKSFAKLDPIRILCLDHRREPELILQLACANNYANIAKCALKISTKPMKDNGLAIRAAIKFKHHKIVDILIADKRVAKYIKSNL